PGIEVTAQECMPVPSPDHLVPRPGKTAAGDDGHPLPLPRIPPDRSFELARVLFDVSSHNGHVRAAERAVLELRRKRTVARVVAGDDDQPRRALVEPVDDARSC